MGPFNKEKKQRTKTHDTVPFSYSEFYCTVQDTVADKVAVHVHLILMVHLIYSEDFNSDIAKLRMTPEAVLCLYTVRFTMEIALSILKDSQQRMPERVMVILMS
jgi:hypothetical protein